MSSDTLIAGGAAGALSRTFLSPFERVKVVLQTQNLSKVQHGREYTGIMDALNRIPKEQGFLSFWRGNGINVIRILPTSALRFTFFPWYKNMLGASDERPARLILSGGLSGGSTLLCLYPLDMVRVQLMANNNPKTAYRGLSHCVSSIVAEGGVRKLYKGLPVGMVEIIPYTAISFSLYELLKARISDEGSKWWRVGCGAVSGLCASLTVYPLDTIRRQIILNGSRGFDTAYLGIQDCIRTTYQKYGITFYYRGCLINALKSTPGTAITFAANDFFLDFLRKGSQPHDQS